MSLEYLQLLEMKHLIDSVLLVLSGSYLSVDFLNDGLIVRLSAVTRVITSILFSLSESL